MAAGTKSAHGTKFLIGDGSTSSESFTEVADVEDISGPSETQTFTEITNHSSSAVERVANLEDPGTLTLTLGFQPGSNTHGSGSSGLRGLLRNQTKRNMRVKYPSTFGTNVDKFEAWVSSFEPSAPTADKLTADCELQLTGVITSTTST